MKWKQFINSSTTNSINSRSNNINRPLPPFEKNHQQLSTKFSKILKFHSNTALKHQKNIDELNKWQETWERKASKSFYCIDRWSKLQQWASKACNWTWRFAQQQSKHGKAQANEILFKEPYDNHLNSLTQTWEIVSNIYKCPVHQNQ